MRAFLLKSHETPAPVHNLDRLLALRRDRAAIHDHRPRLRPRRQTRSQPRAGWLYSVRYDVTTTRQERDRWVSSRKCSPLDARSHLGFPATGIADRRLQWRRDGAVHIPGPHPFRIGCSAKYLHCKDRKTVFFRALAAAGGRGIQSLRAARSRPLVETDFCIRKIKLLQSGLFVSKW